MEQQDMLYDKNAFIRTVTHNLVSKEATIQGAYSVNIKGKSVIMPGVTIKGDLAAVRVGRYCVLESGTLIQPGQPLQRPKVAQAEVSARRHLPLAIGSYTHIGRGCKIEASIIGECVRVGDNCHIGPGCVLRDNCQLLDGTVVAPGTHVPPFAIVAGCPGRIIGELMESTAITHIREAMEYWYHLKPDLTIRLSTPEHQYKPAPRISESTEH